MHPETELVTLGLARQEYEGVVNMPVCRVSTILFKNFADFEAAERGEYPGITYGRYGNPTQTALQEALAALEGADHSIIFQSGMAAIVTSILAFIKSGDHILMADAVYGPARRFCDQELKKFNVEVTYYPPDIGAGIDALIKPNTRLVYLESPGSLTFEMQDIEAIAAAAKKRGCITISDSTWATPLHFRALAHGVDVSMHSLTKYISGHSDFVMGALSCKKEHYKTLLYTSRNMGACPGADDCYLALRGLRTMSLRLKRHQESGLHVAAWLKKRPEVVDVLYPALPGAPGHALWKKYFSGACGLFSVQLKPAPHENIRAFFDGLELFGMGYSWGGFESLATLCSLGKSRTAARWPHEGPLVRLHIGLEHPDDLIADLEQGLARLNGKA